VAALRFLLFAAGQSLLWFGVFAAAGWFLDEAAQLPGKPADMADGRTAAVGLAALIVGLTVSGLAYRLTSALLNVLYGAALIAGGLVLLPVSLGVAQLEPGRLDPARAARTALAGAGAALTVGTVLLWLGWRWAVAGAGRARFRHVLRVGAVAYGTVLVIAGGLTGLGSVAAAAEGPAVDVAALAATAGLSAVFLISGCLLVYHGAGALTATSSGLFRTAPPFVWLALWLVSIGLGWALLDRETLRASVFPATHVVAALAAGGLLIALVAGRPVGSVADGRLTWRSVLLCAAWGAVGATMASAFLEAVADGLISLSFLARSGAFEGVSSAEQFSAVYEHADDYLSRRELLAATLALFSVSPPLVEESMKGLGVRLLGNRALGRYESFVLGVACGAGFGSLEAVLYGASALQEDPGQWWSLMLLRGGATSMHALASGLVGLAVWFAVRRQRRRVLAGIAAAMLMHGAWNGLSVIAVSDALPLLEDLSDQTVENLLSIVLSAWSLVNVGILVLTARVLKEGPAPPAPLLTVTA
jgi:hypothetical protein